MHTVAVKNDINRLARFFYKMHGFVAAKDFDFKTAMYSREKSMWDMAEASYEYWRMKLLPAVPISTEIGLVRNPKDRQ